MAPATRSHENVGMPVWAPLGEGFVGRVQGQRGRAREDGQTARDDSGSERERKGAQTTMRHGGSSRGGQTIHARSAWSLRRGETGVPMARTGYASCLMG